MITDIKKKIENLLGYFIPTKRVITESDDEEIDFDQPPFKRNKRLDKFTDPRIQSDLVNSNRRSDVDVFQSFSNIIPSSSKFGMSNMQNLQKKRIPFSLDVTESGFSADYQNKENASSNRSKYFRKAHEGYSTSTKELSPHAFKYFGREISGHGVEVDEPLYKSPEYLSFRFKPSLTSTASKSDSCGNSVTKRKPLRMDSPRAGYPYNIPLSSKFGIRKTYKKTIDAFRANLTGRIPCGTDKNFTTRESIRLDEKEKYRRLIQQNTSSRMFTQRTSSRSSILGSTVFSNFASAEREFELASKSGAIVISYVDPITTSRSRFNLEKDGLYPIKSATTASRIISSLQLPTSCGVKTSPSVTAIPVINLDSGDSPEVKLDDVIYIVEEFKPASPIKNSLEDKLQKSPIYNVDWLKEKKKYQDEINKRVEDDIQIIKEIKEISDESLRQCQEELLGRVEKRISQLDLTYPRAYIEVPDDEEEILPELTPEMENIINRAFKGGPGGQVLAEKFNIQITRKDLHTLVGLNWLNDEVINFYMNMLMERGQNDNYPSVYTFNTFFYGKLLKTGYASIKRWTKKVDVFAHDLLIIPVHLGMHWCLATIDFRSKTIKYYDSMLGDNDKCLTELKKYLISEHQDKKKTSFDVSAFSTENIKEIPQQMNGSDCGMFSCKFAEYISRNAAITFSQEHMPYFRRRMVYEIVTKKLL